MVIAAVAQWLAWLLRLPSILLLLLAGFATGPMMLDLIQPNRLMGSLLLPFVAVSVALILFEGGLTLNFRELRGGGRRRVVLMLVTLGALTTWILAALAAYWLTGLDVGLSIVLGAILTVTGPTVVLPLLRHIRPLGPANPILKWEGIVVDPIGAVLAVIAFEVVAEGRFDTAISHGVWTAARTLIFGGVLGLTGAVALTVAIRRYWIPDHLQTMVAAMLVVALFAGSNWLLHESGLMTVTVMGIALANQRVADIRHILEFKENLRTFLLGMVFVLLSARLSLEDVQRAGVGSLLFVAALILLVRPLSVLLSTVGSGLQWRDRAFLCWMAPRGIVAAAVTSVFALALEQRGYAEARLLVPIIFATIVGTVLVYGLTGGFVARRLGLADTDPQGLLILGADGFAQELARAARNAGARVLLVDSNRENIVTARLAGLNTHFGSILAEDTLDRLELTGLGRLLALTSNDEVNTLAVQRFAHVFGRPGLFQLPPKGSEAGKSKLSSQFHGRLLFRNGATYGEIAALLDDGATIHATKLTQEFNFAAFRRRFGERWLPLLLVSETGKLHVVTAEDKIEPRPGQTLITLAISPVSEDAPTAGGAVESPAAAAAEGGQFARGQLRPLHD